MASRSQRARSFGSVADEYDRGRPGYPRAAIDWLLGPAPLDVVDLGAGTGKLTTALAQAGHRVVAVEPLGEMSAHLRTRLPDVRVVEAAAEDTGLEGASFDAAVAGSAFHWFDRPRVFAELARILRGPAVLGLLGNRLDREVAWIDRFATVSGSQGHSWDGRWPDASELSEHFTEIADRAFVHSEPVDRERLVDLALSRSQVATLAEPERDARLEAVRALWDSEPELAGQPSVQADYVTYVRRARGLVGQPAGGPR